jgi:hypothetical protein
MRQVNLAGLAWQAGGDGVAAAEPGDGAGVDAGGVPRELAAGVDSRLHPPSASPDPAAPPRAAQAAAATAHRGSTLIGERGATAGSLRKAAGQRVRLGI